MSRTSTEDRQNKELIVRVQYQEFTNNQASILVGDPVKNLGMIRLLQQQSLYKPVILGCIRGTLWFLEGATLERQGRTSGVHLTQEVLISGHLRVHGMARQHGIATTHPNEGA
jgi:hypothetical protein